MVKFALFKQLLSFQAFPVYRSNLYSYLFSNYNKYVEPSEPITIHVSMNIYEIVSLIEKEQVIVLNMLINQIWHDPRLTWNPSDYGNLTKLIIPSDKLWV